MIDVILQVWDLGGQERFEFMKKDYFKGASVVALCFDLMRESSFQKLDIYLKETREIAGPIPILLVGNKSDLEMDLGPAIDDDRIKNWMRTHQITDYIKTSAKSGTNVDEAFQKLSILSMIDLSDDPKLGQFRRDGVFRFKIILVGEGGVGKTSITRRFAEGKFSENIKMTIGVDFLTKNMKIDDELLPDEAISKITKYKELQKQWLQEDKESEEDFLFEDLKDAKPKSVAGGSIPADLEDILADSPQPSDDNSLIDSLNSKPSTSRAKVPKTAKSAAPRSPVTTDSSRSSPMSPPGAPSTMGSPKPAVSTPIPAPPMKDSVKDNERTDADVEKEVKGRSKKKSLISLEEKGDRKSEMFLADESVAAPIPQKPMTEEKLLHRKTTVFYNKQMNPFTLNKLSVVLSSIKVYEQLKKIKLSADRAASDDTLVIKELSPFIQVEPYFPGCVCVPAMIPLDAREESTSADFKITPLATGEIPEASVRLYYEGKLIDTIPTPTKIVKQTAAKFSGALAVIMPIFGPLFDSRISDLLSDVFPDGLWDTIGGIEGFFLILSTISVALTSIFYMLKKPKEAEPVEANFPKLEKFLEENEK